MAFDHSSLEVV